MFVNIFFSQIDVGIYFICRKGFFSLNIALEIMLFATLCTPKINS